MRSLLLTGGSGFFGRHFTRYLLDNTDVERICIYSRGEFAQADMRASFTPQERERLRFFVGDVRDLDRLTRAMRGCDAVVHAAALKRIEVGEYCPDEMVKTNIHGATNVISAATQCKPGTVVFLSSDKACQPSSAYGATKFIGEKLFLSAHHLIADTKFVVTRYGNVAGSTGSVIPTWIAQTQRGEPFRVNNSEVTRFWMDTLHACELVHYTLCNAYQSYLIVPKLRAFKLGDLAEAVCEKYGGSILNTSRSGLIPGEKMHEEMISVHESFSDRGPHYISDGAKYMPFSLRSNNVERLTIDEIKVKI